ncbi:MAG: exodeoxyribonuclease VII small subunit [Candidatus Methanomethylophilaceae archaeon]|nr:exodeoxyribonuclease VII small subunit [Candidatus Methanomethylophilaceae archaeon]
MTEKENTFEENLAQLEELVRKLEAGNLDLDESLKIYEDAIVLREKCRKFLEESERKVQKLMETAQGVKKEEFTV